jgi:hypothetical protein
MQTAQNKREKGAREGEEMGGKWFQEHVKKSDFGLLSAI